jgi:uncharacterized membrane protein
VEIRRSIWSRKGARDPRRTAEAGSHRGAVVSWPPDKKKPKTRQLHSTTGAGALGGAFWGLLFGLIFFIPLVGAAIGAATGALVGSMTDVGISDDFIKSVRDEVTPGTSALFLMSQNAVVDRVRSAFAETHAQLIRTNLSDEQEARLREAFGEED